MLNGKLLGAAFPINKVEVFFDAEDHSNFLGFQWERVSQGRIPIGLDDSDTDFNTIGKTGGEKEVTLSINHIPPHNHTVRANIQNASGNDVLVIKNNAYYSSAVEMNTSATGGGQAHNNMPPYIVMAFWKRVA